MSNDVIFCIPVRGGSRRIPRKNMLVLDGESLIARKIRQVSPLGTVVVGSDDDEMLEEAVSHGAISVRRARTDEGRDSANDMIGEFMKILSALEGEGLFHPKTIVWSHVTSPFVSTETYRKALEEFEKGLDEGYDSLVGVKEVREHLWCSDMRTPMYPLEQCRVRHICAGDLEPIYQQNGALFIQRFQQMKSDKYFFGNHPRLFVMSDYESVDINTMDDWACAKALYELHGR